MSQRILDPEALAGAIRNATFRPCQLSARPSPSNVMKHGAGLRIGVAEQARLRTLLGSVMDGVDNPSAPLAGDAVRRQLGIDLLEVFLSALSSGFGSVVPPPGLRTAGRLRRLKQARDFLTEHLHEPLSVEAICGELGMSRRGVERLFHDSMGIGPNAFLRHQRLHGVRRALQAAPLATGAVKEIALAWGFRHMGHFASSYRMLFGESPSSTLKRQRSH